MKKTSIIFLLLFSCLLVSAQQLSIKVASYNLRNDNRGDSLKGNGWQQRCPVIVDMVLFHDFDLMGTQECKINQINDLDSQLSNYGYIGKGRDDGKTKGEFSAIFYKKDRFEVIRSGDFWMSETPDVPSKGWDAALNRVCSWGEFKDKKTKARFYYFNLHMDHRGVEARKNGARLVLEKIKEIAGTSAPVLLSGDFNVDQHNESYTLLATSNLLRDSYSLAPIRYAHNGTFNNFNPNLKTDSRIDHIFITKQFSVDRYAILTDIYWSEKPVDEDTSKSDAAPNEISFKKYEARMPSDHFPVVVEVRKN